MKNTKLKYLCCAECGAETIGRQWWNQDKGYGICDRCSENWGADSNIYGKKGIHHSISLEDKLRNKSIFRGDDELLEQILKYTKGLIERKGVCHEKQK